MGQVRDEIGSHSFVRFKLSYVVEHQHPCGFVRHPHRRCTGGEKMEDRVLNRDLARHNFGPGEHRLGNKILETRIPAQFDKIAAAIVCFTIKGEYTASDAVEEYD